MPLNSVNHTPSLPLMIGSMTDNEAEALSLLFRDIVTSLPYYNEVAKKSEIAKYSSTSLCAAVLENPNSVLVARDGGEIAGFCFSKDDDGIIWLSWFGVHSSYRRRGIGLALLRKLEEIAKDEHIHKIWCDCRTENEASKAVLSSFGYVELVTVRNHWYGQDFILWEKLVA